MGSPIIVLTTFPDIDTAQRLAEGMVQAKLAACVNIIPAGQSIYIWENNLCKESEYLAVIKTMDSRYQALEEYIKSHHPYELPEIVATQITKGSKEFLSWLETNTTA